jgi:hypothetical protein
VAAIDRFCAQRDISASGSQGQRKDDLAHEYLARFEQSDGVVFVGRAQERPGVSDVLSRYRQPQARGIS